MGRISYLIFYCSIKYRFFSKELPDYEKQFRIINSNNDLDLSGRRTEESLQTITDGLMDSPWPTQGHDVNHTGRSPYNTVNTTGVEKQLVFLTLTFSKDFLYTPGVIFNVVRRIAWENINIYEIASTNTELTFILHKKDAIKGYKVLEKLVEK